MQLHPVRELRILLHESAAAQVHHRAGIHARVARAGDCHSRRRVFLAQRIDAAVHVQRHDRQAREHHANVREFRIRVRQQLIAPALAHRIAGIVVAVIVHPDDAQVLRAVRRLRKERQLRPRFARLHADCAVERTALRVVAHLLIAVAHAGHQRRFALLSLVLQRPDFLQLQHRLHRRLRAVGRAPGQQIQHRLHAVGRLSARVLLAGQQARHRQKQRRQQQNQQRRAQ